METGRQLLEDILLLLLGGVVTFIVQHFRRPQTVHDEHAAVQQGLVERQTKTLDEAFEMLSELTERIKKVETENQQLREEIRKWRNAYARAIRWIHEKGLGSEIPDFLLDSEPRITGVK